MHELPHMNACACAHHSLYKCEKETRHLWHFTENNGYDEIYGDVKKKATGRTVVVGIAHMIVPAELKNHTNLTKRENVQELFAI